MEDQSLFMNLFKLPTDIISKILTKVDVEIVNSMINRNLQDVEIQNRTGEFNRNQQLLDALSYDSFNPMSIEVRSQKKAMLMDIDCSERRSETKRTLKLSEEGSTKVLATIRCHKDLELFGSIDGLLGFGNYEFGGVYVGNPVAGELARMPPCPGTALLFGIFKPNVYHVVKFDIPYKFVTRFQFLDIYGRQWSNPTMLNFWPRIGYLIQHDRGRLISGLFGTKSRKFQDMRIVTLKTPNEQFAEVTVPPEFLLPGTNHELTAMKEQLIFCMFQKLSLKLYLVDKGLQPLFSFTLKFQRPTMLLHPFASQCGIILYEHRGQLYGTHPLPEQQHLRFTMAGYPVNGNIQQLMNFTPSLVRFQ